MTFESASQNLKVGYRVYREVYGGHIDWGIVDHISSDNLMVLIQWDNGSKSTITVYDVFMAGVKAARKILK